MYLHANILPSSKILVYPMEDAMGYLFDILLRIGVIISHTIRNDKFAISMFIAFRKVAVGCHHAHQDLVLLLAKSRKWSVMAKAAIKSHVPAPYPLAVVPFTTAMAWRTTRTSAQELLCAPEQPSLATSTPSVDTATFDFQLFSDYGFNLTCRDMQLMHPANRFLVEWFGSPGQDLRMRNPRPEVIQQTSPIADLNEVVLDAESQVPEAAAVTGGGAMVAVSGNGVASPPDNFDDDSKQTPPGINGGDGDSQETPLIVAEEDHVGFAGIGAPPLVVAAGNDGSDHGRFLIDLNAEDGGDDSGEENCWIPNDEPDRKRMRYDGGKGGGGDDGGPSEQNGSYNLRLFGFDISSNNQEEEEDGEGIETYN